MKNRDAVFNGNILTIDGELLAKLEASCPEGMPLQTHVLRMIENAIAELKGNPNEKRNTWKLCFQNLTLSEDARKKIGKILKMPEDRLEPMFWMIANHCSFCAGTRADSNADIRPEMLQGQRTLKGSVQTRIKNLLDAINGLDEYTKEVLVFHYLVAYPFPNVSSEDKGNIVSFTRAMLNNQNSKTRILVPRKYSGSGWMEAVAEELPFRELLERVARACEESKEHAPKQAGRRKGSVTVFVSGLINIFETYSGKGEVSTTPDGVFDSFLRAVLENLDPEYPVGMDQNAIIRDALKFNRFTMS